MVSSATTERSKVMVRTVFDQAAIIENYLKAVEQGDLSGVLAFFSDNSTVYSPLQGRKLSPAEFFPQVFDASAAAKITLLDIFSNSTSGNKAAAYFQYDWTLPDGVQTSFDAVDIFEFSAGDNKIVSMTALYDTYPLRSAIGDQYG